MTDTLLRGAATKLKLPEEAQVFHDGVLAAINIRLLKPGALIEIAMGLRRKATFRLITPESGHLFMTEYNGTRYHPRSKGLFLGSQTLDDFDSGRPVDPGNRWLLRVGMRFVFKVPMCPRELSPDMVTGLSI